MPEVSKKRAFIAETIRKLTEEQRVGEVVSWPKISFFPNKSAVLRGSQLRDQWEEEDSKAKEGRLGGKGRRGRGGGNRARGGKEKGADCAQEGQKARRGGNRGGRVNTRGNPEKIRIPKKTSCATPTSSNEDKASVAVRNILRAMEEGMEKLSMGVTEVEIVLMD